MVDDGKLPWPKPPFGIILNDDRTMRIDESIRELMARVFATRAAGEAKAVVRALLAEHGHDRTIRGVDAILGQALYMGELRFGKRVNHAPVRRRRADRRQAHLGRGAGDAHPAGRDASSDRLLARLGVLHCAHCGARMVAGGAWVSYTTASGEVKRTRYAFYKCGDVQRVRRAVVDRR